MARRISAGVAATVVVCSLFACSYNGGSGDDEHDDNNFRADVIECEDALERLQRCCPDFDAKPVLCRFLYDKSSGCGTTTTDSITPAFNRDESSCIRDTSCDALVTNKVCERAQAARAYTSHKTSSSSSSAGNPTYTSSSSSSSSSGSSGSSGVWTPPPSPVTSSTGTSPPPAASGQNHTHAPVCP